MNLKKIISEKKYIWMLNHLPRWIMYYNAYGKNDTDSKFWQPRFGYPESWLEESKKEAEETLKHINWT